VEDWWGCLEDIAGLEKKKRAIVNVNIIVSELVSPQYADLKINLKMTPLQYLESLHAHKTMSTSLKSNWKGKCKIPLMNLDLDEEEEEEAAVDLLEEEGECLKKLGKVLGQCAKCGRGKRCKIDKLSTHIHLSFQQLCSWALSLVIDSLYHVLFPMEECANEVLFSGSRSARCYANFTTQI